MTDNVRLNKNEIFASLPDEWQDDLMPQIRQKIADTNSKIVVLDDDPTGTQTVHDVAVLATWSVDALQAELEDDSPAVFILTNTRSMTAHWTEKVNCEIAKNLQIASKKTNRPFVIVSRSDSTLRGHFPLETDVLAETLETDFDGILIIPAFMAGGRYTIDSVHYVAEDNALIPANETPFAQDATFGYANAHLPQWISEKTAGHTSASDVQTITLHDIRQHGADAVTAILLSLKNRQYCVIDAISERDIEVITLGMLQAEARGKHFLYRTAASFAAIRAGIALRAILSPTELNSNRDGGGLVIVGSYVPKTSSQLTDLLASGLVNGIEIDVSSLLDDVKRPDEIQRVSQQAKNSLANEQDVVIYTSRTLITGDSAENSLRIGNIISDSLVEITQKIQSSARYIIAKGGITSSDIATKALRVKRATVLGQILAGIPVWKLDSDCAEPNLTYVVFPGNVGNVTSLTQAVEKFKKGR